MSQRGVVNLLRLAHNWVSAIVLIYVLFGIGRGEVAEVGLSVLLFLTSFPSSALIVAVVGAPLRLVEESPLLNAFLAWTVLFVAGWLQWNVVAPYIQRKLKQSKEKQGEQSGR